MKVTMIYETRCSTNKISELEKITKYYLIFYTNAELHAKTLSYPISILLMFIGLCRVCSDIQRIIKHIPSKKAFLSVVWTKFIDTRLRFEPLQSSGLFSIGEQMFKMLTSSKQDWHIQLGKIVILHFLNSRYLYSSEW